jgi:hypothetical protein
METKFWVRRLVLAIVWGLAVSTWASIGHHLMGMPDVGPLLVIATVILVLVLPARRTASRGRAPTQPDERVNANSPSA